MCERKGRFEEQIWLYRYLLYYLFTFEMVKGVMAYPLTNSFDIFHLRNMLKNMLLLRGHLVQFFSFNSVTTKICVK